MLGTWFSLAINRSVNLSYPRKTFLTCIELTDYSRPWEHEGFDLTFFTPSTEFIDMFMLLLCRTDGHRNSLEVSLPRRSAQVGSKTEELDLSIFIPGTMWLNTGILAGLQIDENLDNMKPMESWKF